jgi:DNA-binding protein HU-beta
MRKAQLIDQISKQTGIVQSDVSLVLHKAIETIRFQVSAGRQVRIQQFGVFKTRKRPAKIARNLKGPVNGKNKNPEPLILEECIVPVFKPSKQFLTIASC